MTTLPTAAQFQAEPMEALALSDALVQLRDCLAGVIGTDGTPATALAALGALVAGHATRSAATTLAAADRGRAIACSGSWTLALLPSAAAGAGFAVLLANTGTGTITLDPDGSELIDGAATRTLAAGRACLLWNTGTEWRTQALAGPLAGPLLLAPGSAAAPALAFEGDADTGLYRAAADVLAVAAGGAERLRVTTSGAQVTGLLTGTAVTQSATDTTAGRLLRVGDFGLGAADDVPTLADFNATDTPSGLWRTSATTANLPTEFPHAFGTLIVQRFSNAIFQQRWHANYGVSGAPPDVWARNWNTSAWTAWRRVIDSHGLLGTVSQSGGVPTGRVFERGSNANGEYVRLADGTQICTRRTSASLAVGTGHMGGFRSAGQTWTFPAAFAAAPAVTVTVENATAFGGILSGAPGTTSAGWAVTAVTSQTAATREVALMAVGRWF